MTPNRVLIIDDEAPMRDMLRRCLEPLDYECVGAETAAEAMEVLQSRPIDLILLDLMLPDVNGYSFFELLADAGIRIPVIIISGCVSRDALDLGWELGAVDYVTKPFNPIELIFRVRKVLAEIERAPAAG
ncbi:MAG: response regulator [Verrucomicrobiota bacterium]